ncbi:MAG: MarR family transcriptional regulator [Planctomycetaceae bacterium]
MQPYDFEESIGYWLTVATQAYHRALNERLAPFGVTYRQSHVLGWLMLEGELTQAELARRMMVEPPTLVRILDRMEALGWISREDCPGDRRRKLIRLTDAAEPAWANMVSCAREVRQTAGRGLSADEQYVLKDLLRRIGDNLKSERLDQVLGALHEESSDCSLDHRHPAAPAVG